MTSLFRDAVDAIGGYTPGEQPQETGWVKLNTNENPYPASPQVIAAIEKAARGRLNIYPDPLARDFCRVVADLFHVEPDWVLPANGSDENLTILLRSFVDVGEQVASPYPSYILYETLTAIQGGVHARLMLNADGSFSESGLNTARQSKLVLVPNPNSPSGMRWSDETLMSLVPERGVFVLDEAYGDFADTPHQAELLHNASTDNAAGRMVITRTLSKSYSLAGIRMGFCIAHPDLIAGMRKVKDSYNCDTLALAAATAAITDQAWMQQNRAAILKTRARLANELATSGFNVQPSQANFLWVQHLSGQHREIYESLKQQRVLIRYMSYPDATDANGQPFNGLRITIGTDAETDQLLEAMSLALKTVSDH